MKVKSLSYKKGISLPKIKSILTSEEPKNIEAPKIVYISVKQVKGLVPRPVVVSGDKVKIGTVVAVSGNNNVYSTVSGVVLKVVKMPSVHGGACDTIVIENDFKDEKEMFCTPGEVPSEGVFDVIKKANIVDYDGVSVYSKIFSDKKITTLVINAVTDEPYETINLEILKQKFDDVLSGAKAVQKVVKATKVILAITKDYYNSVRDIVLKASEVEGFEVALLPGKYPVGDEAELYLALNKKPLKKDERAADNGMVILDVYALFVVGDLLLNGTCDNSRLISVYDATGKTPVCTNVWVRVGSDIKDVILSVRENKLLGIYKVIAGGPMRGIALGDDLAPVTKGLKSLIILKDRLEEQLQEINCVSCGRCKEVCPKKLSPRDIDRAAENGDMVTAKNLGAEDCSRCGCCSYVCPSKRHLTQRISYAKEFIVDKGI